MKVMHLDGDYIVDRRRLKRRLTFWRIAAVIAAAIAVVAAFGQVEHLARGRHLARVVIEGVIMEDRDRDQALAELADDDTVEGVLVHIDSPGGTVVGGESLYHRLRLISEKKPVVAVLGGLGTSAAYMTALGSDHIVARNGTITGSIGVLLQTADVTGLMDMIGVKPETIKSGPLKAQPNPMEPLTPEGREAVTSSIMDIFDMFVSLVEERRSLDRGSVLELADGRVFTGRQALANGLIDALGGEEQARVWLQQKHSIDEALPVYDVDFEGAEATLRELMNSVFGKVFFSETLRLDGVVSLWHPEI
ncbi:MAG: signal peptide peptidase SppA [Rhodospirillales bacterium]|nr:signal peptide peptidase SppA [Rhodospirillales bacterium]